MHLSSVHSDKKKMYEDRSERKGWLAKKERKIGIIKKLFCSQKLTSILRYFFYVVAAGIEAFVVVGHLICVHLS